MGIRDLLRIITQGDARIHRECHDCGQNLPAGTSRCSVCDGEPVHYEVQ
jgi:hypothetical protein